MNSEIPVGSRWREKHGPVVVEVIQVIPGMRIVFRDVSGKNPDDGASPSEFTTYFEPWEPCAAELEQAGQGTLMEKGS